MGSGRAPGRPGIFAMVELPRRRRAIAGIVAVTLAIVLAPAPPASAGPPPTPLLWERTYVAETPQTAGEIGFDILGGCYGANPNGVTENSTVGPRIAVIGDSVAAQWRGAALPDPYFHWAFAAICGEEFATSVDSGRAGYAMATNPDVVVFDLGYNTIIDNYQNLAPSLVAPGLADLQRLLTATDGARCRVILNIPRQPDPNDTPETAALRMQLIDQVNAAFTSAASTHPGVVVADWSARVSPDPTHYLTDGRHLLRPGKNAKINLAIEQGRRCLLPDWPTNLEVTPGMGSARVTWDALPAPEQVTQYHVSASDGRTLTTTGTEATFSNLANGFSTSFRVSAVNGAGEGDPTPWSSPVTPAASGVITGVVRSLRGPLADIFVAVSPASQLGVAGSVTTGPDGTFTISGLSSGQYKVAIIDNAHLAGQPQHYIPEFYDNGGHTLDDFGTATPVSVTVGTSSTLSPVVLDYSHPGSISGSVRNLGGVPLAGMIAFIGPSDEARIIASVRSGADGSFTTPDLPPGTYKVLTADPASVSGSPSYYLAQFYDNAGASIPADFATATTITVSASTSTRLNPIVLTHT